MLIVAFVCFFSLVAAWLFAANSEEPVPANDPTTIKVEGVGSAIS